MSSKIKYRVPHDGEVFTRTSNRIYTHLVLRRVDHARELANRAEFYDQDWDRQQVRWAQIIDGTYAYMQYANVAETKAIMAAGVDAYIEHGVSELAASLAKDYPGADHHWAVIGWAGRYDLAVKQAKPGDAIVKID